MRKIVSAGMLVGAVFVVCPVSTYESTVASSSDASYITPPEISLVPNTDSGKIEVYIESENRVFQFPEETSEYEARRYLVHKFPGKFPHTEQNINFSYQDRGPYPVPYWIDGYQKTSRNKEIDWNLSFATLAAIVLATGGIATWKRADKKE